MRQPDHHNLWMISYDEKLSPNATSLQLPRDADLLATQYALQTLLGSYLMTGEKRLGMTIDEAIHRAIALRPEGGRGWQRFPSTAPAASAMRSGAPTLDSESLRLDDLAESIRQLKVLGRAKYTHMLERHFTVKEQLALSMCGLNDAPLLLDLPVTSEEKTAYLQRHEEETKSLDTPLPSDLAARVRRLWLLLIRAKLEQM